MRFGQRWTKDDIAMIKERKLKLRNSEGNVVAIATLPIKQLPPKKKPLLNKTESLFHAELMRRESGDIYCQAITLKLADKLSYRPDFVTVDRIETTGGVFFRITAYETKAPHRFARAGIQKLRMAAEKFPWIQFRLITRNGKEWTEETITPN